MDSRNLWRLYKDKSILFSFYRHSEIKDPVQVMRSEGAWLSQFQGLWLVGTNNALSLIKTDKGESVLRRRSVVQEVGTRNLIIYISQLSMFRLIFVFIIITYFITVFCITGIVRGFTGSVSICWFLFWWICGWVIIVWNFENIQQWVIEQQKAAERCSGLIVHKMT